MTGPDRQDALIAMDETTITPAPPLDTPDDILWDGYPLSRSGRVLLAVWGLFLVAGFCVALSLEPDPRGYGTHQRLGLPPCSFHVLFGIGCPSCGSTTCFAHFVRGHWTAAMRSNPGAFCLALACALMVPWSAVSVWRGRLWKVNQPATVCMWLLLGLCGISLVQWLVRMPWN